MGNKTTYLRTYEYPLVNILLHAAVTRSQSCDLKARTLGGAIIWSPLCIIVPCHRIVGSNRSLTGYGSGIKTR